MAEIKVKIVSPDCETCEVIEENLVSLTSHKNSFVLKASFYRVDTDGDGDVDEKTLPTLAEQCKYKYVWQHLDGDCCIENLGSAAYELSPTDCSYNALEPHWVTFKEGVGMKSVCVTGDKFVKRYYRLCVLENVADDECTGIKVWQPIDTTNWGNAVLAAADNANPTFLPRAKTYLEETCKYLDNTLIFALQQPTPKWVTAITTLPTVLTTAQTAYNNEATAGTPDTIAEDTTVWPAIKGDLLSAAFTAVFTEVTAIATAWNDAVNDTFTLAEAAERITNLTNLKTALKTALGNTCNAYAVEQAKNVDAALAAGKKAVNCICDIKRALYTILNKADIATIPLRSAVKADASVQKLFKDCCEAIRDFKLLVTSTGANGTDYNIDDLNSAIDDYMVCDLTNGTDLELYLDDAATTVAATGFLNDLFDEIAAGGAAVYTWDNTAHTIVNVSTNKQALITETQKVVDALFLAIETVQAVKCEEPLALTLETAVVTLDASGSDYVCARLSCYVPHSTLTVEYTLLNNKNVVARQSNPCFRVCEPGVYSVIACLNYAKYCVVQDITESNKVTITNPSLPPCPPPCILEEPCEVELCFVNDNTDLAENVVTLGVRYENPDPSDVLQLFVDGQAVQVSTAPPAAIANITTVYYNSVLRRFTIPSGDNNGKSGEYTVVLSKKSARASCSDCITVVNSKDSVLNFGLRFNLPPLAEDGTVDYDGAWPDAAAYSAFEKDFIINPDVTVFEPDNEKDMITTYYCVRPEQLIKMIDDDKFNVALLQADPPATVEDEWLFYDQNADGVVDDDDLHNDDDNYILIGDDGDLEGIDANNVPQSGWVLTKVTKVNGVEQTECLGSGHFPGPVDAAGDKLEDGTEAGAADSGRSFNYAYLNFSKMFKLDGANCDECVSEEDLYDQLYVLTVYSNDGCKSGQFPFMFKKPLEEVTIISTNGCILDCNQTTTLRISNASNGSENFSYQWMANGEPILGASGEQLVISYKTSDPGMYSVVVTDKGFNIQGSNKKACETTVTSNTIVIVKKFSVKIVDASGASDDLVNISKPINLRANVIGLDLNTCKVKYQWLLRDCNGNLVKDNTGFAICLGKEQKLYISKPSNIFLNRFIEVTVSYSSIETVPVNVLNNQVQAIFTANGSDLIAALDDIKCLKKHKLQSAKDSIATTSEFALDVSVDHLNIMVDREVCITPLTDTVGFNVVHNWEYMTEENYNTEIVKNNKNWRRNKPVYFTNLDGTDLTTLRVNGNVPADWISQEWQDGSENCFLFNLVNAQPGVYKVFVGLIDPTINLNAQQTDCLGYGTAIIHVTKTLELSIVGDNFEFVCGECDDNDLQFHLEAEKQIPDDYQIVVDWVVQDQFNGPHVPGFATDIGFDETTGNPGTAFGGTTLIGDELTLVDGAAITNADVLPSINLLTELEAAYGANDKKCIFFDCSNNLNLVAQVTYQSGAVGTPSLLKLVEIDALTGEIEFGADLTEEVTVQVKQVLKINFSASGKSGNVIYKHAEDGTVTLDPSGSVICANVCGIPEVSEKLYVGQVTDANPGVAEPNYIPETYKWQFKPSTGVVSDENGWQDLTLDTTFKCLEVCQPGYYRVLVSKFISDHWLDRDVGVDGNNDGDAADVANIFFDEHLDGKQGNNTLKYYLKASDVINVVLPSVAPQTATIRPTSRNVVSFNQFGSTVNKSSDIGKLKAYVAPEGEYAYQWFKNGQLIGGANESTYKPVMNEAVSGAFSVKVSNHKGEAVSAAYNINYKK